ncbi:hypothetical protein Vadar_006222 [Vaccinium darrowii]|uniref:Uncharacterized protein n=1 Tax=Vaccinium darrowii TaxID=229202 RepID=A0ACB7YKN1_9ERIC|nr:hypothetical protein Vadar_006222 [Vaccinium darrowii]
MAENNLVRIPFTQSPPNPSPSSPLQLSGFLSGDTIQVQGDTEDFQFAVQLNIHHKHHHHHHHKSDTRDVQFPNTTEEDRMSLNSASLSYMTPVTEGNEMHRETSAEGNSGEQQSAFVITRLRSGVLSQVKYFPPPPGTAAGSGNRSLRSWKKRTVRRGKAKETGDVLERVLRRHCLPVRPCSSYALFVMATWGVANSESLSFGETSKRLSKMWCSLPHDEKKV